MAKFLSRVHALGLQASFNWRFSSTMTAQKLNADLSRELVESVDNFLFDCDGVLWDGIGAIPGSLETIKYLKKLGKRVFYATNNSSSTREQYAQKCLKFGYDATEEEIVCTAFIGALYLKNINFTGKVYLVGNPAMGVELDKYGIRHTGIGPDQEKIDGSYPEWLTMKLDPEVNCVMVGFDKYLSFPKILKASSYLKKKDTIFLATNEDSNLPAAGDIVIPGTGTMVHAVKCASRRDPIVLGKPERPMFDVLQKAHNLDPARCCMVGDRLNTDIGLAKQCGLKSLLVLSGVSTEADVQPESSIFAKEQFPDYYTSTLGDLEKLLQNSQQQQS
ncbi:glycerol-3-phosphate phosphatase-like [Haliotis rufescens]|uniref:glycerol-3-phosphate phosphatase-like n=1 Tax=Haliotis rufescens TaxID=6454 RepID=UPI00201F63CB|nr:glycerol-3-phosphate phosphatase-like [Haliotis rufescens]